MFFYNCFTIASRDVFMSSFTPKSLIWQLHAERFNRRFLNNRFTTVSLQLHGDKIAASP
jgi:hypothetical protein